MPKDIIAKASVSIAAPAAKVWDARALELATW